MRHNDSAEPFHEHNLPVVSALERRSGGGTEEAAHGRREEEDDADVC